MESEFNFYIDDDFFIDGITIDVIKNFKILFEIARQLKANTYYNKALFYHTIQSLEADNSKPKYKQEIKKFFSDFISVENFDINQNSINIFFCKSLSQQENKYNNPKDTWYFINSKLPKRVFNKEYPKHGRKREDGVLIPARKGESQLYTTNLESQNLLNNSIFDLRKRESFYVNFDFEINKFILFPNENTLLNTFHAYHINQNEWTKYVATSIIKYFDYISKKELS
jgi:hypothetical protein